VIYDYNTVETLAAKLCRMSGGIWERKRTKKNHWRAIVMEMLAMEKPR